MWGNQENHLSMGDLGTENDLSTPSLDWSQNVQRDISQFKALFRSPFIYVCIGLLWFPPFKQFWVSPDISSIVIS